VLLLRPARSVTHIPEASLSLVEVIAPILVILVMVAANAMYVAAEFALVGARRSRVQEAAEGGDTTSAALLLVLKDPKKLDNYVAGCQIGITVSSLVAGAFGQARLTPVLAPLLGPIGGQVAAVVVVLFLITTFQVVLGELLPKTVALRYPEALALATLRPMQVSMWLFRPLILVLNGAAFALMRFVKLDTNHSHTHVHSPEELEDLYRESAAGGLIDASERDMLAGALNVDERCVREIMTPRNRLVFTPAAESVGDALPRLALTPFSRFPVTGTSEDDLLGIVHLRAVFEAAERDPTIKVGTLLRPPLVVAEMMTVPALWQALRGAQHHCAMVVNEYGSIAGLVSLEDALEEIFGELQDEFDAEEDPIVVADGRVVVQGAVLVEQINARFELELPTDSVDTVSGLFWHELGRLPMVGDEITFGPDQPTLRVDAMDYRAVRRASFDPPGGQP
jgi:putative hemolysin